MSRRPDEVRRPIFGFLWPKPDPNAPVDAAYRQVRPVRVTGRGPARLAVLALGSLAVTMAAASAVLGAVATGLNTVTLITAAVCATGVALVMRGWIVGTYVTDADVRVDRVFTRTRLAWPEVSTVQRTEGRWPWLGLPWRSQAQGVVLVDAAGHVHRTHVYSTSPDLWLRPEAYDMAALRLQRWSAESGQAPR